jgi:hypothetical protein
MKLTNNEIYSHANRLLVEFSNSAELKLPIKINFYLQKNIQTLKALALEIEENRMSIVANYGKMNKETSSYEILPDKVADAQKELADLLSLEQEVQIYMIDINHLDDNVILTMSQMDALMFMIQE